MVQADSRSPWAIASFPRRICRVVTLFSRAESLRPACCRCRQTERPWITGNIHGRSKQLFHSLRCGSSSPPYVLAFKIADANSISSLLAQRELLSSTFNHELSTINPFGSARAAYLLAKLSSLVKGELRRDFCMGLTFLQRLHARWESRVK